MRSSGTIVAQAGAPRRARTFRQRLFHGDHIAHAVTFIFAASIILITALLFYELYSGAGLTRQKFGWSFLMGRIWDPVALEFGALPFIYGTLVTSAVALIIGVPLGVGAAIFLAELAPIGVSSGLAFIIELLAAVPSVIYGLLAIFTLVPFLRDDVTPVLQSTLGFLPFFQGVSYGVSLLAGGAILDLFHDLIQGGWYLQTTANPMEKAEPVEVLAPAALAQPSARARRRSARISFLSQARSPSAWAGNYAPRGRSTAWTTTTPAARSSASKET